MAGYRNMRIRIIPVSRREIVSAINALKGSKATELESLPPELFTIFFYLPLPLVRLPLFLCIRPLLCVPTPRCGLVVWYAPFKSCRITLLYPSALQISSTGWYSVSDPNRLMLLIALVLCLNPGGVPKAVVIRPGVVSIGSDLRLTFLFYLLFLAASRM